LATELERLVVTVEANQRNLAKQLAKINSDFNRSMNSVENRVRRMSKTVDGVLSKVGSGVQGGLGALGVGGLLAGASIGGVITSVRQVAAEFAGIADSAERAGVGTDFLQEVRYAAEQAGGSVEAVDEGMEKFAKNLSNAGKKSSELGQVLRANDVVVGTVEETFRAYADLIAKAKNPQDALNLASMAFGKSAGPAMVLALKQGSQGLAEAAAQAHKFGAVADAALIKKAAEVDDAFAALARQIKVQYGSAVIEGVQLTMQYQNALMGVAAVAGGALAGRALGPLVATMAQASAGALTAARTMTVLQAGATAAALAGRGLLAVLMLLGTGTAIGAGIAVVALGIYTLATRQDEAKLSAEKHKEALATLDTAIKNVRDGIPGAVNQLNALSTAQINNAETALKTAEAQLALQKSLQEAAQNPLGGGSGSGFDGALPGSYNAGIDQSVDDAIANVKQKMEQLAELRKKLASAPTVPGSGGGGTGNTTIIPDSAGGTAKEPKQNEYEREVEGINDKVAALQIEQATVGMSTEAAARYRTEQELLNAAKEAELELTPTLRGEISTLAGSYAALVGSIERVKAATEAAQEAQKAFASEASGALEGLIVDGESLNDVLADVAKNLARMLIQASIAGTGPLAGLMGTASGTGASGGLFGMLFKAAGGSVHGPGTSTSDSIPTMLSDGEYVVKASEARRNGPLLEAINSGRLRKLAKGGPAGMRLPNVARRAVPSAEAMAASRRAPQIHNSTVINAAGADPAALARVETAVTRMYRDFDGKAVQAVQKARRNLKF
jgi:hypothetical protein